MISINCHKCMRQRFLHLDNGNTIIKHDCYSWKSMLKETQPPFCLITQDIDMPSEVKVRLS